MFLNRFIQLDHCPPLIPRLLRDRYVCRIGRCGLVVRRVYRNWYFVVQRWRIA